MTRNATSKKYVSGYSQLSDFHDLIKLYHGGSKNIRINLLTVMISALILLNIFKFFPSQLLRIFSSGAPVFSIVKKKLHWSPIVDVKAFVQICLDCSLSFSGSKVSRPLGEQILTGCSTSILYTLGDPAPVMSTSRFSRMTSQNISFCDLARKRMHRLRKMS